MVRVLLAVLTHGDPKNVFNIHTTVNLKLQNFSSLQNSYHFLLEMKLYL